jgi:hypothetical protein
VYKIYRSRYDVQLGKTITYAYQNTFLSKESALLFIYNILKETKDWDGSVNFVLNKEKDELYATYAYCNLGHFFTGTRFVVRSENV